MVAASRAEERPSASGSAGTGAPSVGRAAKATRRTKSGAAASAPIREATPPRISVVTTVLDERKHIQDLLDSLLVQRVPHEIIIVDAGSTDGTWEILQGYARVEPSIRLFQIPGKRGAGRNAGVARASTEHVAFIDGDCMANGYWLESLMEAFEAGADVVAGSTRYNGFWAFANMQRVELEHRGQDVTWPSCNLAYRRQVFLDLGGFDERFVTAEDIDLNFRAIDAGCRFKVAPRAIVYAQARDSVTGFLRQAYWNGYGRKQLTLKHGKLWQTYSFNRMARKQISFWGTLRLFWAVRGYIRCKLKERPSEYQNAEGMPTTHSPALTVGADDKKGVAASG